MHTFLTSPHLQPCDYFLFQRVKRSLKNHHVIVKTFSTKLSRGLQRSCHVACNEVVTWLATKLSRGFQRSCHVACNAPVITLYVTSSSEVASPRSTPKQSTTCEHHTTGNSKPLQQFLCN